MDIKIEIYDTKENYNEETLKTVKVENIFLHSKYYPLKEAEGIVKSFDLEDKKNIVVYGMGLGYHILQILKMKKEEDFKIKIFDLQKDIFKVIKENFILKKIIKDSRVEIFIDDLNEEFLKAFSNSISECDFFYIYKPSFKIMPQCELKEVIFEYEAQKKSEEVFGIQLKENCLLNEKIEVKNMVEFYNTYDVKNKTVIIAAAGPSLDSALKHIKYLKENRKDIMIFAVGTALKPLMDYDIKPDMFCVLDPQDVVSHQIKGYENSDIPMCFLYTASHKTVTSYNGPKYIFYNSPNKSDIIIECANSVATPTLSIAIKGEAKNIVFVGQDLAFIGEKWHSTNTAYGDMYIYNKRETDIKTLGVNGEFLKTTKFYMSIKKWIEKTININKPIKFINCSKGANIDGAQYVDIEKLEHLI